MYKCACGYTYLCVLGAVGNAPLGHTLTDSTTTALILIMEGRDGIHTAETHTCTYILCDSWEFTLAAHYGYPPVALTINSYTVLTLTDQHGKQNQHQAYISSMEQLKFKVYTILKSQD